MYDCLNMCMLKFSLFHLCELLVIKKFALHFGTSEQSRVFNPGVCYSGSQLRESQQPKFSVNKYVHNVCLIDVWPLIKKTKLVQADYNFKLISVHSMLPVIKFLIHHEKVRPIDVFESR